MSESVVDDLLLFRKDIPVKLNPHPVFDNFGPPVERDVAMGYLGLDPQFSYILFFGFIRHYKGLDLLLEAFSGKEMRNRKIKLIIAGEFYEDPSPYRDIIAKNNLADDVVLFDRFINDSEVASFFSIADVVVQPYRSATQSGVTQIAYHFDKPMIVTDTGGLREIVPDGRCGYVVSPDKNSVFEAIDRFYTQNKKEEFTENVLREKEKYSWNRMTASITEVYNKCSGHDNKK